MQAEFEEKQYEQHLNLELLKGSNLLFPPGQYLENTVGFDAALFTVHPKFWKNFPNLYKWRHWLLHSAPKGISLPLELWQLIEDSIEDFPKFRFNAFIQHKRPEYMKRSDASEWRSWNSSYYRYRLMSHQQDALCKIDRVIGNDGVVVYACPAFHKTSELWDAIEKRKLIEFSNFCQVRRLTGHNTFTYREPGNFGIAHSEPEQIESEIFLAKMTRLSELQPAESNRDHLVCLSEKIDSVMLETPVYAQQYKKITSSMLSNLGQMPIASSLIKIDVFRFLTRTQVLIGY